MGRIPTVICLLATAAFGQRGTGELRVTVRDAAGLPLQATGTLVGPAVHIRASFNTDAAGTAVLRNLPVAAYRLEVAHEGFATATRSVQIAGPAPVEIGLTLGVAPVNATVLVEDAEPMLDPYRTGTNYFIGRAELRDRRMESPGRSTLSLVDQQPGWLLEANGVLHPRESEYAVQYVVDGIPLTDNRSPSFSPDIEAEDVQEMNVLTSGYPAEFGRKLGGVIEIVTALDRRPGTHGKVSAFGQSFATAGGYARLQQGWKSSSVSISGDASRTDRYLDPPVEQNYTNAGTTDGASIRYERDLTSHDRVRAEVQRREARFEVPNGNLQQESGQRQDRTTDETAGRAAYTRVISPRWVLDIRGMGREVSASLWSNALSTPILAWQDRGFREFYGSVAVSGQLSAHSIKAGVQTVFTSVDETFGFDVTDPEFFDPDVPAHFRFQGQQDGREQAAYVQDLMRAGAWTISAGLRWDNYRLLMHEHAWSPRLGAAWHSERLGLLLRASYDRAFQTPAFENLLLASSPQARLLGHATFAPVRPSRGDFVEAGFVKSLFDRVRLDAKYFVRSVRNIADDSLLLNTGVSFPIAFASGDVRGTEVKLDVPRWGPVSGYISYTNMIGKARLPATGGLFLGADKDLLQSRDQIPLTQDQRNMARAWIRYQIALRLWTAVGASYGSGLPVEMDEAATPNVVEQQDPRVLARVNLSRGRVRPSFSLDISAGADLWRRDRMSVRIQGDVLNLTDRLNVINFAGVFSGTALGPPRTAAVRMVVEF